MDKTEVVRSSETMENSQEETVFGLCLSEESGLGPILFGGFSFLNSSETRFCRLDDHHRQSPEYERKWRDEGEERSPFYPAAASLAICLGSAEMV